ncbi:MAG: hypothetical protein NC212_10490 [Staphylococcus sp.]|nr:hypothetical protein [Staphylococcus sp.]
MKFKRFTILLASALAAVGLASAQSYFDDDIYYNPAKASKQTTKTNTQAANRKTAVVVYDYPAADNYTVNGTRTISVDDYNRRGIFASDSLASDTVPTDFTYTRRIEQFYNPEIISATGDQELANIYYMEPDQVNIYVNTPSGYWGYDYFYPYSSWNYPYWANNYWRWNSSWYWGSWYDPYWSWGWGPSWAWGPGWGWGPAWGPSWGWGPGWGGGWGPSWGWNVGPRRAPDLLAGHRPGVSGSRANNVRPGYGNSYRPSNNHASNMRPGSNYNHNVRPGVSTNRRPSNGNATHSRPSTTNTRPNNNYNNNNFNNNNNNNFNNNSYSRPSNTGGGRFGYGSGGSMGGSRGSGGMGGRSTGGGRR